MRRIVHLDSMMAQFGLHSHGGHRYNHDMSSTNSHNHTYSDGSGNTYEVVEFSPKGREHIVTEVRLTINRKRIAVKSYKQMFRYLNEKMLEKIMEV